jgi:hypothetical protein
MPRWHARTQAVGSASSRIEAAAVGCEVLLVDADTYGGAVAHATIRLSSR